MFLMIIFSIFVGILAYKRYMPILGISSAFDKNLDEDIVYLDLRDYQATFNEPIHGSINIPFAYLKRYYKEIPKKKLVILASDSIEKNLAIRFLLRKKFKIVGFKIVNYERGENQWTIISKQKIV